VLVERRVLCVYSVCVERLSGWRAWVRVARLEFEYSILAKSIVSGVGNRDGMFYIELVSLCGLMGWEVHMLMWLVGHTLQLPT